ncbi:MAG: hypothetical protein WCD57_08415 [Acidobacteriaceae bacterium]
MSFATPLFQSFSKVVLSLVASALIMCGLASCSGGSSASGNGSGSQPTLTLSPSSIRLTAGAAGQQVSLLLGVSGGGSAVTVSLSGLPSGVTVSPATLLVTPGVALPLTMTASSSTPTSMATLTFTTTVNSQTASTQASLSVTGVAPADFTLSVMPASVSLTANGTAATVSVLATAQNGFSSNVQVAITGLPTGVAAQPSSLTLTPGTASTLTLTAPAGTAAASATATLTGTSGTLMHSASLPITVTAPPPAQADFSLAVSPQSLSLTIGGTGQAVQLAATALNGFTGTIAVALGGLPSGVVASPTSVSLTPGTPQTITLTAGNSAQAASANVVFTGTSGSTTHTATLALTVASSGVNVTTYHNDNARDGWNASETVLTTQNVNVNNFGKLRELPVDGNVDAQPLYVSGLSLAGQPHNVVIVVTEHGSAYAFDADSGTQLWKVSALGANETSSDDHGCNQISPEIGITDTPVIDRSHGPNGTVFLVATSKDASSKYHQRLHALDLATGAELQGSPTEITATFPGTGYGSTNGMQVFDPGQYAERVGLLLMNGQIYLAWTSHCDEDPYTGWLMAYSESTLQQTSVLNLTPNGPSTPHFGDGEGSVWMSGAGLAGDTQGNIFFLDANGTFDSTMNANGFPATGNFGNAFMKVSTTGNTLAAADYFAAYNLQSESDADQDLGSGGAMLLPDQTDVHGNVRHLAVGAGKDTNIYVVDRDNMGKFNASSNNAVYQELPNALSGGAFSMAALFNNTVYYAGIGDHLKAFPITSALLATTPASESVTSFAYPGATPSVSSNGVQSGIVWAIENQGGAGVLHAYDTTNLPTELYDSNQAPNSRDHFSDNKFVPPMIANGKVFVGTKNSVAEFGLLP